MVRTLSWNCRRRGIESSDFRVSLPVRGELLICQEFREFSVCWYHAEMRDLFILFIHLITTVARLASPNGVRSVVAESLLVKHQLLILNRSVTGLPISAYGIASSPLGAACPWRIANLPGNPRVFGFLLRCGDARSRHPFHPCHHYCRSTCGRGGIRSVVAESVLVKHQLLILNRSRQRLTQSPPLRSPRRRLCALSSFAPSRLIRSAIVLKPSTLLSLHQALRNRKYRLLFSSKRKG